ncbi:MAG: type III PLP-dependent enzyme, partial [Pseudomonadota bacterium]
MFNTSVSRLAQPGLLPDYDRPTGLPVFESVAEMLAAYDGDDAIYVLYPKMIAEAAETYLEGFPGEVLYAVKANPHPAVLKILWSAGLRHFDVASIREIDLVRTIAHDAKLYLMHPVKSRRTIRHAYAEDVRDMAFDTLDELNKILEETDHAHDLNLHVRLSVPSTGAAMPLAGKFGTTFDEAVDCLQAARPYAAKLGVTFHVGSQCMDIADYENAIAYVRTLVDAAGVNIESVDCGGGFAIAYPGMTPPAP